MRLFIQKRNRIMRTKRLAARKVRKQLHEVRTRMEQICSKNLHRPTEGIHFFFYHFYFALVVSSSLVAQVFVTVLQDSVVFQYSVHPCLLLTSLYSSACDLKNNHLVSSRRLSTTFSMHLEDRGDQESYRRWCERGGVSKSKSSAKLSLHS